MAQNSIKSVVERVVTVAKAAGKAYGVSFGTVIGRNPDGSLNVDPGTGGCVRVVGSQNARVGDRVPLGTEPALGTLTQLDPIYLAVDPPVVGCPTDPRDIPPDGPPLLIPGEDMEAMAYQNQSSWESRNEDQGVESYGIGGSGAYISKHGVFSLTTGTVSVSSVYDHDAGDVFGNRRVFIRVPLASVAPGKLILSAKLQLTIGTIFNSAGKALCVVTVSSAFVEPILTTPPQMSNWALVQNDALHLMGSVQIPNSVVAYTVGNTLTVLEIPLNRVAATKYINDAVSAGQNYLDMAILMLDDVSNMPPPSPVSPHTVGTEKQYGLTINFDTVNYVAFKPRLVITFGSL